MISDGAVFVVLLTLPSSLIIGHAAARFPSSAIPPYANLVATPLGTFIALPLLAGALNAFFIYWLIDLIHPPVVHRMLKQRIRRHIARTWSLSHLVQ